MTALARAIPVLVLAALVLVGVLVAVAADDGLGDRAETIVEEPDAFVGERVEISGELSSYYPDAFTLGGGYLDRDELLVSVEELDELPEVIRDRVDGLDVRVVGVVDRLDERLEIVAGEAVEPFEEGTPYVRAARVEIIPE